MDPSTIMAIIGAVQGMGQQASDNAGGAGRQPGELTKEMLSMEQLPALVRSSREDDEEKKMKRLLGALSGM